MSKYYATTQADADALVKCALHFIERREGLADAGAMSIARAVSKASQFLFGDERRYARDHDQLARYAETERKAMLVLLQNAEKQA